MKLVSLQELGLRRADKWLFRNMSLSFSGGQFIGVTGPSGVGKSSLLACLDSPEMITEGKLVWHTQSPAVGRIFQGFRLVEAHTALTNVLCGRLHRYSIWRSMLGFRRADREAAFQVLVRLGVHHTANRVVARLSGGEKQRIATARTLFQDPDIILADEPFSQLDQHHADRVLEQLLQQCRNGKLVLCVSHERERLREVADFLLDLNPCWPENWSITQLQHEKARQN